ncbi:MAG: helix-turn-helix domain-containing protein [Clostridiales bacterium]|nr:helix-turn-helix domain-containing protein [Clostridiales bacterium]
MDLVTKSLRPGMPCELDIFYEENDGFSEHINDTTTYKLVLITAGSFVFEEDGEYRTVTAPAGLMLNERINFHVVSEEGVRTRTIFFRPTIIRDEFTIEAINSGKYEKYFCALDKSIRETGEETDPKDLCWDRARMGSHPFEECFMNEMAYQDALLLIHFTDYARKFVCYSLMQQELDILGRQFDSIAYEINHQEDNLWILRIRYFLMTILFMSTADVYRYNRQVEIYKDPFVAKVASYLWLHMSDEITLPGILRKFSVNKNQLNDAFNKEVGMSCMNYLEHLRINWAKHALQYNFDSIPISEISRRIGYSDTNYFSKVFKKYTGMTPTEFQKNMEDLR